MPRTPEVCSSVFCPPADDSTLNLTYLSRLFRYLLPLTFCLLLSFITINAQSSTATLSGTVTDQNGGVIPGANVVVINIAHGFQRTAITDGWGVFLLPLLSPGIYNVKAEQKGFNPVEVRDVVVNVNDQVTLRIQLSVGSIGQIVSVVESRSQCEGTTLSHPALGRGIYPLPSLTPPPTQQDRGFELIHQVLVEFTSAILLVLSCGTLVIFEMRMFLREWRHMQATSTSSHSSSNAAKNNAIQDATTQSSSRASPAAVHQAPLKNISVASESNQGKKPTPKRRRIKRA
jgi:hypothetical protein